MSNLAAVQALGNSVTFENEPHGPAEKRGRSASTHRSKTRKEKFATGKECYYIMCRHRNSRSRRECRLAKAHEEKGGVVSRTDK